MADSKQMIELEVRQLQEQLLNLFEERKSLQREFEQLTNSSQQILLQIKEDTTSASERKLHNYEAEKRRIEEKLEALEEEILEKDKKIAHLDSKAGEFLQQIERLRGYEEGLEKARKQIAAAAEIKRAQLEARAAQAPSVDASINAKIEHLQQHNQELKDALDHCLKENEEANVRISALESTNQQSKEKIVSMEVSHRCFEEKLKRLTLDKDSLIEQLQHGSTEGLLSQVMKEKEEVQDRFTREKEMLLTDHQAQMRHLQEQLDGLHKARQGDEEKLRLLEAVHGEAERRIAVLQQECEAARTQVTQLVAERENLESTITELQKSKEELKEEITIHKDTISNLKEELEAERNTHQTIVDNSTTLQNNILNLQKQVESLNNTCTRLARDLEAESKLRIDTQTQLTQIKEKYTDLQSQTAEPNTNIRHPAMKENLHTQMAESVLESVEQATEQTPTIPEQRTKSDEVTRLKAVLGARDEDLSRSRLTIKDLEDRLRISEVVRGEVEEYRRRVRELEGRLSEAEARHQQQITAAAQEAARCVAAKEKECLSTISDAFDQQDSETSILVRQHQEALSEAQLEVKEKAAQLDAVSHDYSNKLKYEDQLAALRARHEAQVREVEETWKARAEKMLEQRESELLREKDHLAQEWTRERKELERLTQVAAAAFQSGTESVELLKKQVAAQRRELEDLKLNHGKEVGELKALLELKRRARGSGGGSGVRLGVSLEEAAEFEYLKNILYQYMLGKETQTLSKVLCAVVKFDGRQQQAILEHEEQRQSMLSVVNGTVHPSVLQEGETVVSRVR